MKKLALIVLLLITCSVKAQLPTLEWAARYHNTYSYSNSLSMDKLGNIFISGAYQYLFDNTQYLTLKYNSSGVFQWMSFYQGPESLATGAVDIAYINIADGAGNVYVGGKSRNNLNMEDMFIIKYNSSGDSIWTARYNGPGNRDDYFTSMITDKYANVYITGSSFGLPDTDQDYVTIKYDSAGNKLWERRYNNVFNSPDHSASIAIDSIGNIYVTGYCTNANLREEYVTIKYNNSGIQQWVAKHTVNSDAQAVSIAVDRHKNVYVIGQVDSLQPPYAKYTTVKYDSSGNLLWVRDYKSSLFQDDTPYKILLDTTGNPIISGGSLVKYNSNGVFLWADTLASGGRFPAIDKNNNVYLTIGRDSSGLGWIESFKYNENGNILWALIYGKWTGSYLMSSDILIDENNYIYLSANTYGQPNQDSILLLKYSQPIGITWNNNQIPETFDLYQNYPNPFNPRTKIKFDIPQSIKDQLSNINLVIYDITGREVGVLFNGEIKSGKYEIEWDASGFASGIYFYSLRTDNINITKKMILIK